MKNILNLPGVNVIDTKETDDAYRVHASLEATGVKCPQCQGDKLYAFGTRSGLYMDLPMHGKQVGIDLERQRFRCRTCGRTFLQPCEFIHDTHRATERLVRWIEDQSLKSTFAALAGTVGLDEKSVRNMFGAYVVALESRRQFRTPEYMGIDELWLLRKPRCIITNVNEQTVINLLPDRNKPTVASFLSQLDTQAVKCVCIDMWPAYRDAARKVFPKAAVVVDKFHVVRMANACLDKVRKDYGSRLSAGQRRDLMRRRHLLLKRESSLSKDQLAALAQWNRDCPELGEAHAAKESFFKMYDAKGRKEAEAAYRAWFDSLSLFIREQFLEITRAMKTWSNEVFSYFDHPVTNAYTECLNGLVKMMNRQGRGYSFEVIRVKTLLAHGEHKPTKIKGMKAPSTPEPQYRFEYKDGHIIMSDGIPISTFIKLLEKVEGDTISTISSG